MNDRTTSLKRQILLCFTAAVLALSAIAAAAMFSRPVQAPAVAGVLIPNGKSLQPFSLVDHRNRAFTHADLVGQWHLVSYGYTHCPDVCPTTLMTLAGVARLIENDPDYDDVRFLFYTVDPDRDTVARLAEYVPWFHEDFIGLTQAANIDGPELAFERSLGMVSVIEPIEDVEPIKEYGGYSVSHGLLIYLINPAGDLQAVLKPATDEIGMPYFSVDQIYRDYRAVRDFVAGSG